MCVRSAEEEDLRSIYFEVLKKRKPPEVISGGAGKDRKVKGGDKGSEFLNSVA